ncbi:MAG: hypothetical protein GY870_20230 [archaeon]|nr:hypothetical protein [archaeon]
MTEKFEKEIMLSDGKTKVLFKLEDPKPFFESIIKCILIPYYKEKNDWNESIRRAIKEVDMMRVYYELPSGIMYHQYLLKEIESKLGNEIDKVEGVDHIEILFLNMDDYVEEISDIMNNKKLERKDKGFVLGNLISGLNTFEISELLLHYIEEAGKK